ncbi:SgcJ/EcaC family oxidoreductase [Pseudonocardia sp. KRD291]|uniref:SgcJ/EcaC family oxidoreductase n=1 Tax=Pseudonocardia sp. KRD291 TaxID=2792007 RepID=UPI001C4A0745|nr:SgcJ/EcaC family oxidoreductase [Pseudonocardia sp. KRD291]MBW0103865.1 SgcJ/EcaC family oxidoreductase [Pseudonocardia sp. KRD291]
MTSTDRGPDETSLRALFARLCRTWTDGDARAYGACFVPDCSYVSFDGARATSRDAVVASHDALFRGVLFGSALVGEVDAVQFLGPDTALVHGTGSVQVAWRSRLPRGRATRNTLVAVRRADAVDGWLFAAVQNTRIRPVTVPGPDSVASRATRSLVTLAARAGLGRAREVHTPS